MKKLLLLLFPAILMLSCEKDMEITPHVEDSEHHHEDWGDMGDDVSFRMPNFYNVCHTLGNGNQVVRSVNENTLQNHIDHGDAIDFDGDGYFNAPSGCGTIVDCDDNDPNVFQNCCSPDLLTVLLPDGSNLYVHPSDNSSGIEWGGYLINIDAVLDVPFLPSALADFAGLFKSEQIVLQLGAGSYAASVCENLSAFTCDDWYLPSLGELNVMHEQLGSIGDNSMPDGLYWSSTEFSSQIAWVMSFDTGGQLLEEKFKFYRCRCVRR